MLHESAAQPVYAKLQKNPQTPRFGCPRPTAPVCLLQINWLFKAVSCCYCPPAWGGQHTERFVSISVGGKETDPPAPPDPSRGGPAVWGPSHPIEVTQTKPGGGNKAAQREEKKKNKVILLLKPDTLIEKKSNKGKRKIKSNPLSSELFCKLQWSRCAQNYPWHPQRHRDGTARGDGAAPTTPASPCFSLFFLFFF